MLRKQVSNELVVERDSLAHLVDMISTMYEEKPRVFGNKLKKILKDIKGKVSSREYQNFSVMALSAQKIHMEIYEQREERNYNLKITSKNLQIANKEVEKALAEE